MPESLRNLLHQGDNAILLTLALMIAVALLLLLSLIALWRIAVLRRQMTSLTRGANNANLEQILVSSLERVEQVDHRVEQVEQALAVIQAQLPHCIQRVNMLRYDAFEDVGGQQSFCVALLDAVGDGVVVTSVYSRLEIRVYAKAIKAGKASHALSEEEARVLRGG